MNNFTSLVIAVLEHVGVLTDTEARKLVKDLHTLTIPDDYDGASRVVGSLFDKHDVQTVADKAADVVSADLTPVDSVAPAEPAQDSPVDEPEVPADPEPAVPETPQAPSEPTVPEAEAADSSADVEVPTAADVPPTDTPPEGPAAEVPVPS